jgi:hypothetical protein
VFLSWERSQETHFKGFFSLDLCCGNFLSFWKCPSFSCFSFWVVLFGASGSDALRMQSVLYI